MEITSGLQVPPISLGSPAESLAGRPKSLEAIGRVAADFESLFVSLILKEMRQTLGPEALFGGDAGDSYGGLFDLYMGQHLGKSGAFGIARMVQEQLMRDPRLSGAENGPAETKSQPVPAPTG